MTKPSPAVADYIRRLAQALRDLPACAQCKPDRRCSDCHRDVVAMVRESKS